MGKSTFKHQFRQMWQRMPACRRYAVTSTGALAGLGWARAWENVDPYSLELNIILTLGLLWLLLREAKLMTSDQNTIDSWLAPESVDCWRKLTDELRQKAQKQFMEFQPMLTATCKQHSQNFKAFDGSVHVFQGNYLQPHPLALKGQVAVVTLAGGQATRLGIDGPKGCLGISLGLNRSLFALQAMYLQGLKMSGAPQVPWAIMTSPATDAATRKFFYDHDYFGLNPKDIAFFIQDEIPLTDNRGRVWVDSSGDLLKGPDGNGSALHQLAHSPIWKQWTQQNIQVVVVLPVDNPLAYPYDVSLIDSVASSNEPYRMAAAVIERASDQEKVGVFVSNADWEPSLVGRYRVIEYSEMDASQASERDDRGNLKYRWANTGILAWSFQSLNLIAQQPLKCLPWHEAHKCYPWQGQKLNVVKRERFIFDWLQCWPSHGTLNLVAYPREWVFAPVKTAADIELSCTALVRRDRLQLSGLAPTCKLPAQPFELGPTAWSPNFYHAIAEAPNFSLLWQQDNSCQDNS